MEADVFAAALVGAAGGDALAGERLLEKLAQGTSGQSVGIAGDYLATVTIQADAPVQVPVRLHVFNFALADTTHMDTAYYVEGSRVMLCEHHEGLVDPAKRPYEMVFDRCMPSVFAFARQEEASVNCPVPFPADSGYNLKRK